MDSRALGRLNRLYFLNLETHLRHSLSLLSLLLLISGCLKKEIKKVSKKLDIKIEYTEQVPNEKAKKWQECNEKQIMNLGKEIVDLEERDQLVLKELLAKAGIKKVIMKVPAVFMKVQTTHFDDSGDIFGRKFDQDHRTSKMGEGIKQMQLQEDSLQITPLLDIYRTYEDTWSGEWQGDQFIKKERKSHIIYEETFTCKHFKLEDVIQKLQ
jgi:hypothetical protein